MHTEWKWLDHEHFSNMFLYVNKLKMLPKIKNEIILTKTVTKNVISEIDY